jgi:hypothetical protein
MSLSISTSKIATLCPDEYRKFSEAYDKFTDFDWAGEGDMTLGEAFEYVCDRVADGDEPDGKLKAELADAVKGVITALDRKGIHGVVPGVIDTETEVALLFTIPEAAVFTRVPTEEGKRIFKALNATEADFEDTDCYLA